MNLVEIILLLLVFALGYWLGMTGDNNRKG
jgi:hypothetical protein